jgi:hypothetical protein
MRRQRRESECNQFRPAVERAVLTADTECFANTVAHTRLSFLATVAVWAPVRYVESHGFPRQTVDLVRGVVWFPATRWNVWTRRTRPAPRAVVVLFFTC